MKNILAWILQILCAAILFGTSWVKLSSKPSEVYLFTQLGMEPSGRFIIGIVEGLAAFLFLSKHYSGTAALLALGTMLGALIAHVTIIGFDLKHTLLLSTVFTSSLIVLMIRWRHLPFLAEPSSTEKA